MVAKLRNPCQGSSIFEGLSPSAAGARRRTRTLRVILGSFVFARDCWKGNELGEVRQRGMLRSSCCGKFVDPREVRGICVLSPRRFHWKLSFRVAPDGSTYRKFPRSLSLLHPAAFIRWRWREKRVGEAKEFGGDEKEANGAHGIRISRIRIGSV